MRSEGYATQSIPGAGPSPRVPGTIERVQSVGKGLNDLLGRLEGISRALHGPRPEGENAKAPQPNSLSAYVETVEELLSKCHEETGRIHASLGIE